jgi:hypothetical protein
MHKDCRAHIDESFHTVGNVFSQFSSGDRTFRTFEIHRRDLFCPRTVPRPLRT